MRLAIFFTLVTFSGWTQSFAPEPGVTGSTAVHADSSIIIGWASNLTVSRGYLDVAIPGLGFATYGSSQDALGPADGFGVVSLGDGGEAIIQLERPIFDGTGPDFAVFENGFIDHYMEFAFVEVSTNGVDFVRFENTSEIPIDQQLDNFSISDCRMVNNLAGKYRQMYGTPFDLNELSGNPLIDVNNINYIRLIDVIGSVDPLIGSFDSFGNPINDPYPTPFESGGFDLDAIGIIHEQELKIAENASEIIIYPNPFYENLNITHEGKHAYVLYNVIGNQLISGEFIKSVTIDTSALPSGVYICKVDDNESYKLLKK